MKKILLSIASITYNHQQFIAQAIDSWLMQKTNFDFEIIIGEDCSTDNTRQIIEEYIAKYSNKIKLITSESNVGMMPNFIRTLEACKGKYIALCEGDDYWTDPLKLQKQVDFLEENEGYSGCFHNATIIDEINNKKNLFLKEITEGEIIIEQIVLTGGSIYPTASLVFKNYREQLYKHLFEFMSGDWLLILFLADKGNIYFENIQTSIYRRHNTGICSSTLNDVTKIINHRLNDIELLKYYNKTTAFRYDKIIKHGILKNYRNILNQRKVVLLRDLKYILKLPIKEMIYLTLKSLIFIR